MNGIELRGLEQAKARFAGFGAKMQERIAPAMARIGTGLFARVEDNLGGAVLNRRSGRLAAAQTMRVVAEAQGAASVAVGFDPAAVPYGAIQEFGGTTRAHLIAAKNARSLAFAVGGALAFAKSVHHPGSRIPARSFLRAALAATDIGAAKDALAAEIQ